MCVPPAICGSGPPRSVRAWGGGRRALDSRASYALSTDRQVPLSLRGSPRCGAMRGWGWGWGSGPWLLWRFEAGIC